LCKNARKSLAGRRDPSESKSTNHKAPWAIGAWTVEGRNSKETEGRRDKGERGMAQLAIEGRVAPKSFQKPKAFEKYMHILSNVLNLFH